MGGDATLWHGMWTPSNKEDSLSFMRRAFGIDSPVPTMVQQWYRDLYPSLYEEVKRYA